MTHPHGRPARPDLPRTAPPRRARWTAALTAALVAATCAPAAGAATTPAAGAALALPAATTTSAVAAPTAVRMAHVTPDAVTLRWDEVPGATGYVVSRAEASAGPFVDVASTDGDVFVTDEVGTAVPHWYRVQARDAAGTGAPSATAVSSLSTPAPPLPAEGLRLDLGPGPAAPGFVAVGAGTAWTAERRYGFVDTAAVADVDSGGPDALRGDHVLVGDTELVVDLPNGDYRVDLVAGDPQAATDISLTAERMVKVQPTARPAGQYLEMSFDIALVDGQLNLDLGGTAARLAALSIVPTSPRTAGQEPTLWITGDSTVQTYTADYVPQAGWGQMIGRFLDDGVTVDNRAIGGRSSRNFISQGRLDEVLRQIRPGDYLFAQFGHNDNTYGVDDRFAAPADYANYLRTFVEGARQRGATPVIVTPVSRRSFAADGTANVSFPAYVEAAEALAAETGTALVDLSASSRQYLTQIGPEEAKSVFLWVPAGVYPNRPSGTQDDTHFQEYGAIQMARLVAEGVGALDDPLAAHVTGAQLPDDVPATPTGVVAGAVSSSGASLTWSAVDDADVYQVFGKPATAGDDAWALVTTSTLPQAAVTGLAEGGTYDLRVVAVNGRGPSNPSASVRITTKAPVLRLDVQLAGNPLMPGYTELSEKTLYTAERGWGWGSVTGLGGRDRGTGFTPPPTDLERDFLLPATSHELLIDVPNGTYAVTTWNGDWIGTSRSNVQIEGKDFGASNAGRGSVSRKVSQPVQVADGQITLVMTGTSSRLNGVEVTPLLLAPGAVTLSDLTVDGTAVSVALSWTGSPDAQSYRVLRTATGGTAQTVGEVSGTTFVDTTADVGQAYTYTVVALDPVGTQSVPSAELEVVTVDPDVAAPAAPQGLAVGTVGKNEVPLTWTPVEDALFYQVYRLDERVGQDDVWEQVGRATEAAWTDSEVLTTVGFTYAVTAVNAGGASARSASVTSDAPTLLARQAERLDRAPVAVDTADGVYVGWRLLGDDPQGLAFHVYRDGRRITSAPVTTSTNLLDAEGTTASTYRVATVVDGIERWATEPFVVQDAQTLDVPLDKPADGVTKDGQPYSYRANDASVGDLDGDGQYELVLKWDPSNSKDNSQAGYTGRVYVDAYRLDGTRLWRIDLGDNIRAGAHYTQVQVFDLDGDGRAEVVMKTADGTVDGAGTVVGDPRADYRNSSGYVLTGPELLTVFDGRTGAALDTVDYTPARGDVGSWGDTYGNRVDRFLAGTAYLDGEHPSLLMARGYYTRMVVAAYDWDGTDLTRRWVFDTDEAGEEYEHQGNHNLSVADVDGDQKDEIVYGSLTLDDDGEVLHSTGLGHGDALHVSDFDPARPGLEVFAAHEDMGSSGDRGATFRDAATGEVLWSIPATRDTGRAAMADVDAAHPGAEGWAVGGDAAWNSREGELRAADGTLLSTSIPAANFLTWWDGDLLREIGDHDYSDALGAGVPTIGKWDTGSGTTDEVYRATGTLSANGTKGTPALQADLLGDWREELVTRTEDSTALRIATTVDVTEHRLRTLVSDPVYRLGVAWQNTGYNQPPHTSYFLGEGMATPAAPRLAFTAEAPVAGRVPGPATARPAVAKLSHDNARDADGDYTVTVEVAKGQNAQVVALLEDGVEVARRDVVDATPSSQVVRFALTGRAPGDHVYTAVLTNQHGSTTSKAVTVKVRR